MKQIFKVLAMALIGAAAMSMVACNNGGGNGNTFSVSNPTLSFSSEGGSEDVTVIGGDWTAVPSAGWITVAPASGIDGGSFRVTVGAGTVESSGLIIVTNTATGATKSVMVTQEAPGTMSVTDVTLNKDAVSVAVGGTRTLIATVVPEDAADKSLSWSSNNEAAATVANGIITAVALGEAVITVTTTDGEYTATCNVTVREPDVYVGGYVNGATGTNATYWKNGEANTISEKRSYIEGIYVTEDDDVYAVGFEYGDDSKAHATLWKNGVAQTLNSSATSQAHGVFVSGDDVYAVGFEYNEDGADRAMLWKNGVGERLCDQYSQARSVFVSGNDVYIAGFNSFDVFNSRFAVVWKNGVIEQIHDVVSDAFSIYVSGDDVHVAGVELGAYQFALVWKNGVVSKQASPSAATSIFVLGNDVYVGGTDATQMTAMMWKNGVSQTVSGANYQSAVNALYGLGNDIYAAGSDGAGMTGGGASFWKNGEKTKVGMVGTNSYALFVN